MPHALRTVATVAMYAYLVALAVAPHHFLVWRDFALQGVALGLITGYALVQVVADPAHRSWRVPLAGWPLAFLVGNLVLNGHTGPEPGVVQEVLSVGIMLLAYPCAVLAIVQIHRGRWTAFSRAAVLDSLVAALAIWATFMAFVLPAALHAAEHGKVDPLLVLAFPICDLTVLSLVVAAISLSGERPERMSGWLILAVVICGLGDSAYGISSALGTWAYGTPMDGTWVVGCALVGLGAGAGPPSTRTSRRWGAGVLVVPLVSAATALALLVVGNRWRLTDLAVGLGAASVVVALLRVADAYAQVRALAETERLATTDDLTGLANRRAFYRDVEDRLRRGGSSALMLIDLDGFKEVNDTLGHGAGDELLHTVARRLESGLPGGASLARLGGDEFAVCVELPTAVAPGRGRSISLEAAQLGEQLLATLRGPAVVAGEMRTVAASLGIALFPAQAADRTELMRLADVAMYAAKRAGGGVRVHQSGDDAVVVMPGRQLRRSPGGRGHLDEAGTP